ncbi:MAG TPA: M1 family metallopeptidase [Firmicutes bacterium]|jgi:hypothetical protein|nr:M1 family metallopeptidase [Bacillota bacterium]
MKKRLSQISLSFLLLFLIVIGSLLLNTPVRRAYLLHAGRKTDLRLDQAFHADRLTVIGHEVEIRFSPGMVTGKSIIEYEAGTEAPGFQPFILHNGFVFESIKQNGKNLHFEKWFTCGQVTFWKVYPKPIEDGEKSNALYLLYTGSVSRRKKLLFFSADQFWYPQTPQMCQGGQIDLFKCIVDQGWTPVFSGVLDLVTEVKDGVKSYEFSSPYPVPAAMLQIGKTWELQRIEAGGSTQAEETGETSDPENAPGYPFVFYRKDVENDLFSELMEKTTAAAGYFHELFGDLPRNEHDFLFSPGLESPGDSNLYYTAFNLDDRTARRDRQILLSPETERRLLEKIAGIWWGGTVFSSCEKGGFLAKSLARYAGYLAFSRLHTTEEAGFILEDWYQKYLAALARFKRSEKPLAGIYPLWDAQRDLAYYKAPLVWHALRFHLGDEAFFELLREFFWTSQGRAGTWEGLRELAARASVTAAGDRTAGNSEEGRSGESDAGENGTEENGLDWFFDYFLYANTRLDLQVRQVVTVEHKDGCISQILVGCAPAGEETGREFRGRILLRVETAGEEKEVITGFPVDGGWVLVETAGPPLVVSLDPEKWWPDVDRSNNEWYLPADAGNLE